MNLTKVISKNVTEICTFFTFPHVRQTCFACNFLLVHFLQLFQRIRNQREILRFWYLFRFLFKKLFGVILALFANFEAKCAKKRLKIKSKNVFCKCVLDFNFAPIKGSVFFICERKVKFAIPYCALQPPSIKSWRKVWS